MKILLVSDFHFHEPWFDWVRHAAPSRDLLVIAGDLLDQNHPSPPARQIERVAEWIQRLDEPVAICGGNHDRVWNGARARWETGTWLPALAAHQRWTEQGIFRFGEFAFLLHHHRTPLPRGCADIWITHAPPADSLVAQTPDGRDEGDPLLAHAIRRHRPWLVLCGHEHHPLAWSARVGRSLCLNSGRNPEHPEPNHILIDTAASTATWRRGEADCVISETVQLPSPGRRQTDGLSRAIGLRKEAT